MAFIVLVVEDEQNISDLIKERLGEEGYQVRVASSGAEAFRQVRENSPDIITLDIYLPDDNGLNILHSLKADPATSRIPVIIVSSSDEGTDAKDLGAEDFIRKPVNFERLLNSIRGVAERSRKYVLKSA
ncbi:MAG: response regulator transcription factor [Endomicrobiales bacterium]